MTEREVDPAQGKDTAEKEKPGLSQDVSTKRREDIRGALYSWARGLREKADAKVIVRRTGSRLISAGKETPQAVHSILTGEQAKKTGSWALNTASKGGERVARHLTPIMVAASFLLGAIYGDSGLFKSNLNGAGESWQKAQVAFKQVDNSFRDAFAELLIGSGERIKNRPP